MPDDPSITNSSVPPIDLVAPVEVPPKTSALSHLTKKQKLSLGLLALFLIGLPISYAAIQLQVRLTPKAYLPNQGIVPTLPPKITTNSLPQAFLNRPYSATVNGQDLLSTSITQTPTPSPITYTPTPISTTYTPTPISTRTPTPIPPSKSRTAVPVLGDSTDLAMAIPPLPTAITEAPTPTPTPIGIAPQSLSMRVTGLPAGLTFGQCRVLQTVTPPPVTYSPTPTPILTKPPTPSITPVLGVSTDLAMGTFTPTPTSNQTTTPRPITYTPTPISITPVPGSQNQLLIACVITGSPTQVGLFPVNIVLTNNRTGLSSQRTLNLSVLNITSITPTPPKPTISGYCTPANIQLCRNTSRGCIPDSSGGHCG